MRIWLALAALLASLAAEAKTTKSSPKKQDSRTIGLGRSCKKRADCKGHGQVCIRESDAHGKERPNGFCALPCTPLDMSPAQPAPPAKTATRAPDAGTASSAPDAGATASRARTRPLSAAEIQAAGKTNPSRCPPRFQCRSKGAGVPIDLCVKG